MRLCIYKKFSGFQVQEIQRSIFKCTIIKLSEAQDNTESSQVKTTHYPVNLRSDEELT
jgi:hypothetical protein